MSRTRRPALLAALTTVAAAASLLAGCSVRTVHVGFPATSTASPQVAGTATAPGAEVSVVGSAAGSTAASTAMSAGASAGKTGSGGCSNLVATRQVKDAVLRAHQGWAHLQHIRLVPGSFYYGRCGTVEYAGTPFELTAGATNQEQVALQDDGAAMMFYQRPQGGSWRHVTEAGFPAVGCTRLPQIPHALAVAWHDCPQSSG